MDMSTNHRTGNVNRHVQVQIAAYQIIGERHRGGYTVQFKIDTHIHRQELRQQALGPGE